MWLRIEVLRNSAMVAEASSPEPEPEPEPELQLVVPSAKIQIAVITGAHLGRAEDLLGLEQSVVFILRSLAVFLRSLPGAVAP
jgi:hypothetical protein